MTTLPHFWAIGDAQAIGVALGRQARRGIKNILPTIDRFRKLQKNWAGSDYLAQLEAAARQAFPQYVREIEGIAIGADVDFAQMFLWNCRGDFPDVEPGEAAGCTSLMLPSADSDAPNVIAHNEDGDLEEDGNCFLVSVEPEEGPAFTSFYIPGLIPGHSFGFNQAGLVQTINHILPADRRPGIPRHFVTRAILSCDDLDAATAILSRTDRASGFHHNLGQAGDSRLLSVEAPASGWSQQLVTGPHCHTNHLLHPEMKDVTQTIGASSKARQQRGDQLLSDMRDHDPQQFLLDQETAPLRIYRRNAGSEDSGFTLASGIFEIEKSAVHWRVYHQLDDAPVHEGTIEIR